MIQLVTIALIGVTALAFWAWSRRRRRIDVHVAPDSPHQSLPPLNKQERVASNCEVIFAALTLEPGQTANPVSSPALVDNRAASQPPESNFASFCPHTNDIPPIEESTGTADEVPNPSSSLETEAPTLKKVIADNVAIFSGPGIDQAISAVPTNEVAFAPPESGLARTMEQDRKSVETLADLSSEEAVPSRVSNYRPLSPALPIARPRQLRSPSQLPSPQKSADLRLRVQIVFGRSGGVKTLALVPDRREGMPDEIEITIAQGKLHLTELRTDCYEPLPIVNASHALSQSVEWFGPGDARRWRWV